MFVYIQQAATYGSTAAWDADAVTAAVLLAFMHVLLAIMHVLLLRMSPIMVLLSWSDFSSPNLVGYPVPLRTAA